MTTTTTTRKRRRKTCNRRRDQNRTFYGPRFLQNHRFPPNRLCSPRTTCLTTTTIRRVSRGPLPRAIGGPLQCAGHSASHGSRSGLYPLPACRSSEQPTHVSGPSAHCVCRFVSTRRCVTPLVPTCVIMLWFSCVVCNCTHWALIGGGRR